MSAFAQARADMVARTAAVADAVDTEVHYEELVRRLLSGFVIDHDSMRDALELANENAHVSLAIVGQAPNVESALLSLATNTAQMIAVGVTLERHQRAKEEARAQG